MNPVRVGLVCSIPEEGWHSIDLVAEMLMGEFATRYAGVVSVQRIAPSMRWRLRGFPVPRARRAAENADRLINRFWDYPRHLRRRSGEFDLFHLVEQSYGQLVRELPAGRTVVTCHDLETFRSVLEPQRDPRPAWFRRMARAQLTGVRTAARVICVSHAVRDELLLHGLADPDRVSVIPNGTHPACSPHPDPAADAEADRLLGPARSDGVDLLHVGSTVPRKRLDVLLRVFAAVRRQRPPTRLVRVGGPFTPAQERLARKLGVRDAVVVLPFLRRDVLAAVYRRAAVVLQTSDAEGFGLPVTEAMACGTPVVASDLPVMREVGGAAATYCPVADVDAWGQAVAALLAGRSRDPDGWEARRRRSVERASLFSWEQNARSVVEVYRELLGAPGGATAPGPDLTERGGGAGGV
ncbi:MAG: glycosyltransferase family 4 protein [Gemmatimonadetes bacterium]|nr:glycosyltransferase family 4 protein [Gemmatimonadota bacterium]